ncbi:PKD domain-containing protein [Natrinema sp. 74]|uniref:PKD domain-containing protein n=1 Tax=Natrinema sp. 74 TaxID=3384159 RepID=UPI0038D4F49C
MLALTGAATSTAFVAGFADTDTGDSDGVEIEPDTQIEFYGQTSGWIGIAPDAIADERNPTLILQEGESYEIGWTRGDGAQHNIAIQNENDEVVDDLATEVVTDPEDQWLEFEASSEMVSYLCEVHPTSMVGDIQVEGGGDNA